MNTTGMSHLQITIQIRLEYFTGLWQFLLKSVANNKSYKFNKFSVLKENIHRGADKSLARPGRKQATATEDFDVYISYS